MITREKFEFIKEKYGHWTSWAIWPILLEPTPLNLSGSGIAMFATTIPVVAALLVLYGQGSSQQERK